MKYSKIMKIISQTRILILILLLIPILNSCSSRTGKFWDPADAREIDPNAEVRARQAIEEGRAPSAMGIFKGSKGGSMEFASSNVLWRASLDILDFLPLANVDYTGGLIITDWYSDSTTSNESLKITVRFLSNDIRADGLLILVYKKVCNNQGVCRVKKVSSTLEKEIKDAILARATKMQKGVWAENRKKYQKKRGKWAETFDEKQARD